MAFVSDLIKYGLQMNIDAWATLSDSTLRTQDSSEGTLAELDEKQIRLLEKDCALIWGEKYPKLSHYTR